jgi:hypothetical protein
MGENPAGAYAYTVYLEEKVLKKRPYLKKDWCLRVLNNPLRVEWQQDGQRIRHWGRIDELEGRILRVVALADGLTIHNAFPDKRFRA